MREKGREESVFSPTGLFLSGDFLKLVISNVVGDYWRRRKEEEEKGKGERPQRPGAFEDRARTTQGGNRITSRTLGWGRVDGCACLLGRFLGEGSLSGKVGKVPEPGGSKY